MIVSSAGFSDFLSPKIQRSTQKKMQPPMRFAAMVAAATFQPPIQTMQAARIGELSCQRSRYKKNFFIPNNFSAFLCGRSSFCRAAFK